jgi:hypothetical protein
MVVQRVISPNSHFALSDVSFSETSIAMPFVEVHPPDSFDVIARLVGN